MWNAYLQCEIKNVEPHNSSLEVPRTRMSISLNSLQRIIMNRLVSRADFVTK